jgi:hypothetical protein
MDELRWDGLVTFESRIDDAIVGALQGQDLSGFEIRRWLGSKEGASGRSPKHFSTPLSITLKRRTWYKMIGMRGNESNASTA